MKVVGLIPARAGSKRVPGKNMALLAGKPLLQWAIEGAKESGVFDAIVVSSDWPECLALARNSGIHGIVRPPELCTDQSHDFEWVRHAMQTLMDADIFVILRPTSPFRTPEMIRRALDQFLALPRADSMRAVERTTAHPRKSWEVMESGLMYAYDDGEIDGIPWFDLSTQALGDVYCQNGCIHVAWTDTLTAFGNVSGERIKPFFTEGREGIDINTLEDLQFAEWLIGRGNVQG